MENRFGPVKRLEQAPNFPDWSTQITWMHPDDAGGATFSFFTARARFFVFIFQRALFLFFFIFSAKERSGDAPWAKFVCRGFAVERNRAKHRRLGQLRGPDSFAFALTEW